MFGHIFGRELGGINRHFNRGHDYGWQAPTPSPSMYLERLETASSDHVHLSRYCQGLPIACQFGRDVNSHLCAVTDEDGQVLLFDTRPGVMGQDSPIVQRWPAHNNAVFDYSWISNDSQCLTASGDQTVALWDVETTTKVTTFIGHKCSVRSVASCPSSPAQCASGARDGHIMLWDSRVNKKKGSLNHAVKSIKYAHSLATRANLRKHRRIHRAAGPKGVMDTQQSVTCVLYQTDNLIISSGANDGCVKMWDTRKWYTNSTTSLPVPVHTFHYPGHMRRLKGIVTMCMDPWKSQLFVSYTDNKVYRYQLAGQYREPQEYVYAGHRNDTFFVRCAISPDGKYLLSGSGRNTGVIWEVDKPDKRPLFLIGHTEDVSAVDWCSTDVCKLATVSDDRSLRIWRPDARERHTEDPTISGFAYSSSSGQPCRRQARVHIVQDEFPFLHPSATASPSSSIQSSPSSSPAHMTHSPAHIARSPAHMVTSPAHIARSSSHSPAPSRRLEPSMRQVFWATCVSPRRSPRKHCTDIKSPVPSTSQQHNQGSCPERLASPRSKVTGAKGQGCSKDENKGHWSQTCDSAERTKNGASSPLPFSSYALRSTLNAESPNSKSHAGKSPQRAGQSLGRNSNKAGQSPSRNCSRVGQSPSRNSPRAGLSPGRRLRLTPVKSPNKLLTPPRSSPVCVGPLVVQSKSKRQLFSSPTSSLPNSVLDAPKCLTPPPASPRKKKIDWLTKYRLAKSETVQSSAAIESPNSGVSPKPWGPVSPLALANDDKCTPKRRKSTLLEKETEDTPPGKRRKVDRSTTPKSGGRRGSFSKAGTSTRTPSHRATSESPKTPTNMSIKRYLHYT